MAYVERMSQEVFSEPLPRTPAITSAEWAQRAEEAASPSQGYVQLCSTDTLSMEESQLQIYST